MSIILVFCLRVMVVCPHSTERCGEIFVVRQSIVYVDTDVVLTTVFSLCLIPLLIRYHKESMFGVRFIGWGSPFLVKIGN